MDLARTQHLTVVHTGICLPRCLALDVLVLVNSNPLPVMRKHVLLKPWVGRGRCYQNIHNVDKQVIRIMQLGDFSSKIYIFVFALHKRGNCHTHKLLHFLCGTLRSRNQPSKSTQLRVGDKGVFFFRYYLATSMTN